MPIFVAAGAAAAYSYYKKRSSNPEEEEEAEGVQAEAEESKCSCSTSCDCDCKASTNDDPSSDASGEANKALTGTNAGEEAPVPEKEDGRPAPTLLEEWNKKYGANRGGRTGTTGSKISSVEGETLSRSTSVPVAENRATCTYSGSDTDDNVAIEASVPAETIGVDDKETNKNADAAGDATLLQTWNDRYPHLAKKGKQRRQRFDGPAGKMVRNFLAKRNAGPSPTSAKNDKNQNVETDTTEDAESSEVEKGQKTDLCVLEQNENATLDPERRGEKDSSIENASFGTDALYKEVASAVFGGELSNR